MLHWGEKLYVNKQILLDFTIHLSVMQICSAAGGPGKNEMRFSFFLCELETWGCKQDFLALGWKSNKQVRAPFVHKPNKV